MQKRFQQKNTAQSNQEKESLEVHMEIISRHLSTAEEFINKKDYKHAALEEVAWRLINRPNKLLCTNLFMNELNLLMLEVDAEKNKIVEN